MHKMKKVYFKSVQLPICPYCGGVLKLVDKYNKIYKIPLEKQVINDKLDCIELHHIECMSCHKQFKINWSFGVDDLQIYHDEELN